MRIWRNLRLQPRGAEERIDPRSPWWGEHMARYRYAAPEVRGKRVLDIACGTGYGLAALQDEAAFVVGVDVDPDAVETARREVRPGKGEVRCASGTALPFDSGQFDVVTSFETLEHVRERAAFVAELRRVLAPDGVLLLSTPNALYTLPVDGRPTNPFHVHEYAPDELRTELSAHFGEIEIFGQQLDARFVVPPFYWDQRRVTDPVIRAGIQLRRVLHRFPRNASDRVSNLLWGHDFFPRAEDYSFSSRGLDAAPVLLAVCRGRGSAGG